jgi:DNA-directed RNA polymerase
VRNLGFRGDRLMFTEDMETAERLTGAERFYTPMNLDWRGRVYGLTHFNFQRDDRVRALFQFADGEPIGEEGLWWLKVHVANCGDFGKISKRPLDERIKWVDENLTMIEHVGTNPTWEHSAQWWSQADSPFLFVAACTELSNALTVGPSYITRLPVSFDGSCSGLQHLCAMTRSPEGKLVNLTDNEVPADVYTTVADRVVQELLADDAVGVDKARRCGSTTLRLLTAAR